MKILAIRGRNLASLEGDFEIDFTAEPLLSAGIFAISGPTGAGKSTLLDAMCLALFARTPRTDQAKENNVKLQDVSNEQLEENILSIYAKLYHKYESDKKYIPEGNLIEVKFEDFEADAMGMTENIYQSLSIPGFAEAQGDIAKYVGGKKGYKKNKYKYDDRTIRLVEENWDFALKQWDYNL